MFSISDTLYIIIMNALINDDDVYDKYEFVRRAVYRKNAKYNQIKLIISSTYPKNDDVYEYFNTLLQSLRKYITPEKMRELKHVLELKYGVYKNGFDRVYRECNEQDKKQS